MTIERREDAEFRLEYCRPGEVFVFELRSPNRPTLPVALLRPHPIQADDQPFMALELFTDVGRVSSPQESQKVNDQVQNLSI